MSILIKGMEMPMRCGDCPFYGLESAGHGMFYDFCKGGEFILCSPDNEIDENCPLVPVPTPHGRLIDADEFFEKIPPGDIEHDEKISRTGAIADVCTWVLSAPTVIEAEE